MATTSRIAILNFDGSVDSIYCHYDGYPSHNGKILLKYYNDEMKIRKLIFWVPYQTSAKTWNMQVVLILFL